jgi:flagellin
MRINQNISAMNAYRQLVGNQGGISKSLEKLSSGLRINRASDDAAGLAISEKMRSQVRGLRQAVRNAQDGISMIQTAEGALQESHNILQKMRELAVQSATDTNTASDRAEIQKEVDQLAKELTRISNTTEFNTKNLMAGNLTSTFHIGANAGQKIDLSVSAMDAFTLNVATSINTGGLTTSNTAVLTGVTNFGEGLSTGNYSVVVTNKANASVTSVTSNTTTASVGVLSGSYTGRADVALGAYQVEVLTLNAGNRVQTARWSADGGATWTTVNATGLDTARALDVGNGLTLTLSNHDSTVGPNDTFTFGATAQKATIQLADNAGTGTIGAAVNVAFGDTVANIGNFDTDKTITVRFNLNTLTNSATNYTQFEVQTVGSKAAEFNADGTLKAEAYVAGGISVRNQARANTAITTIDVAIESVSTERSKLGALQNRLEHTINNLGTAAENLAAAESRIRDVDMAEEMMKFTKFNILNQAATAMLAQANALPQSVLQLLG